jgi:hypothetical protein
VIDVLVGSADDADAVMAVLASLLALEPNQFEVFNITNQPCA